jgi:hypothetical protein
MILYTVWDANSVVVASCCFCTQWDKKGLHLHNVSACLKNNKDDYTFSSELLSS